MSRALAAVAVIALFAAAPAHASRLYRAGEVVLRTAHGTRVVHVHTTVRAAIARLAGRPGVRSASPNWIAHASFVPDDPGRHETPGGWQSVQWNFLDGPGGVNAPGAWDNLIAAGRPGGAGVVVAVVDTGVAYRDYKRFKRDPDLTTRLRRGYDFVDNDRIPLDTNGHGTHVASTIAEATNNGLSLTGLAYGATIMPVRVLDRFGAGDSANIAAGIRYAAQHGAQIINLSFEFPLGVTAGEIPDIISALRFAHRRGVLVVGASGNEDKSKIAYPARASDVLSVGAITEHGCQADYSNHGSRLDLSAPGGGADADLRNDPACQPDAAQGRNIYQYTLVNHSKRDFGLPGDYEGTSMAAPHVSATAALIIASGVIGPDPTPAALIRRLESTADDLGKPGYDSHYGWGKVDAARATAPAATPTPTPTPEPTVTSVP